MMMMAAAMVMFLVPVAALGWRIVVTKSRSHMLRIGGAAAAMATIVGAVTLAPMAEQFSFKDWRGVVALAAASSGSIYLLLWSQRHRTNQRHRTLSIIAAVVGLVPVVAMAANALLFGATQ